eukprot:TRINITY_DN33660_c0_g1_i1.p1 TRINITY_DN33660_c0_g1~~TRINITY_DN33660_c0_g1_i1.p1  ORF type:complete len:163 (+),score=15.89 TRINITY_DN33660_c0_g1_i1:48-536(+)
MGAPVLEEPFAGLYSLPPLHVAVWKGDLTSVQRLLAQLTDVNATASWTTDTSYGSRYSGVTPLHVAADSGAKKEILVALLRAGADISISMSQMEMGYHMGEGSYFKAADLIRRRQGDEAAGRFEELAKSVPLHSHDVGSRCQSDLTSPSCFSSLWQGLCSRL